MQKPNPIFASRKNTAETTPPSRAYLSFTRTLGSNQLQNVNTIQEVLDGDKYQELIKAHEEERFDDISYCKNCDQLYEVPESLVWTNIESRKYNTSKVID